MASRFQNVRTGTCSWSYDSWVGLVYSEPKRSAAAYLPEYAAQYDTAEVFAGFVEAIEPMLRATDAIIFEFEYQTKAKMLGGATGFMDRIGEFLLRLLKGPSYAIEPRNAQYLNSQWFSFLRERGVAHVFSQKLYLPNVWEACEADPAIIDQMPRAVSRMLGGDRAQIEKKTGSIWDAVVEPRRAEIEKIVGLVASYLSKIYAIINANNHYEGSAPLTIKHIRNAFERQHS